MVEEADGRPSGGVRASGCSHIEAIRFGMLPVIAGQVLHLSESDARSAIVVGIAGAGGIGRRVSGAIRTLQWREASSPHADDRRG